MVDWAESLLIVVGSVLLGGWFYHLRLKAKGQTFEEEVQRLRNEVESEKRQLMKAAELEAKESLLKIQESHDEQVREQRAVWAKSEARLQEQELELESSVKRLEARNQALRDREQKIAKKESIAATTLQEAQDKLAKCDQELNRLAGLTAEEAKQELIDSIVGEAEKKAVGQVRAIQERARADGKREAQKILAGAVQRLAGAYVSEKTVTTVKLPSDDLKGRIIGREGRNIRAIESATGVDVIIDDTPDVVILSSFHPIRRETARLAMEKLVEDGRIHPARIEEVVVLAKEEMDERVVRAGEQAVLELGIHGLHRELVKLLGALKFRSIDGQNMLDHSIESAVLAGLLAAELGFDEKLARRAGLLHCIGYSQEHSVDGDHASIGADVVRRYGEKKPVVEAIRCYRQDNPRELLTVLLQVASRLSASRPGARQENLDQYLSRLDELEELCLTFKGVDRAWAMQAGTEVRIIANYAAITDDEAMVLAGDIAEKIEKELTYPGEVRVSVLREARATEIAH